MTIRNLINRAQKEIAQTIYMLYSDFMNFHRELNKPYLTLERWEAENGNKKIT